MPSRGVSPDPGIADQQALIQQFLEQIGQLQELNRISTDGMTGAQQFIRTLQEGMVAWPEGRELGEDLIGTLRDQVVAWQESIDARQAVILALHKQVVLHKAMIPKLEELHDAARKQVAPQPKRRWW
jgi:hypothetical protein